VKVVEVKESTVELVMCSAIALAVVDFLCLRIDVTKECLLFGKSLAKSCEGVAVCVLNRSKEGNRFLHLVPWEPSQQVESIGVERTMRKDVVFEFVQFREVNCSDLVKRMEEGGSDRVFTFHWLLMMRCPPYQSNPQPTTSTNLCSRLNVANRCETG